MVSLTTGPGLVGRSGATSELTSGIPEYVLRVTSEGKSDEQEDVLS